jgi:hypothetical protein
MFRVIAILVGIVLFLQLLGWFFTVALPFCVRLLGDGLSIAYDMLSDAVSWLYDAWRGLRSFFVRSSPEGPDAKQLEPKSLLESADNSDMNLPSKLNPTPTMWPFGSKDAPSDSAPIRRPNPTTVSAAPSSVPISQNSSLELAKTKSDLSKAQTQVKSLEDQLREMKHVNTELNKEVARLQERTANLELQARELEYHLHDFQVRHDSVSAELAALKPFAAVKTDQRRMIYTVSPELHKKWQSIMRDTTRLQVLELLGQPTEILAVSSGGASPIQLVRKGVPAPRPELMQHVTNLVVGDGLLKDWVRGVGRTAWVFADDTLAPGVIFFASESDGGQVFRIFPPEC